MGSIETFQINLKKINEKVNDTFMFLQMNNKLSFELTQSSIFTLFTFFHCCQ